MTMKDTSVSTEPSNPVTRDKVLETKQLDILGDALVGVVDAIGRQLHAIGGGSEP